MKTAEEIFKKHYEKVTGKPCGNMELDHMSYAIDAMKEYAEQSRPEGSGKFYCDCKDPDIAQYPHSNTPFCFDCKLNIKQ